MAGSPFNHLMFCGLMTDGPRTVTPTNAAKRRLATKQAEGLKSRIARFSQWATFTSREAAPQTDEDWDANNG